MLHTTAPHVIPLRRPRLLSPLLAVRALTDASSVLCCPGCRPPPTAAASASSAAVGCAFRVLTAASSERGRGRRCCLSLHSPSSSSVLTELEFMLPSAPNRPRPRRRPLPPPAMPTLEIEACDVIKIVLQLYKENSLHQTFQTLQSECQVSLNTVDSLEIFVGDINFGRWDAVLPQVAQLKLPRNKLGDLYEQIVPEIIELRELDTARSIVRQTQAMGVMRQEQPDRYL